MRILTLPIIDGHLTSYQVAAPRNFYSEPCSFPRFRINSKGSVQQGCPFSHAKEPNSSIGGPDNFFWFKTLPVVLDLKAKQSIAKLDHDPHAVSLRMPRSEERRVGK